ncbi:MAG TPA: helix-turn-helix domain-containing protein [Blastocatellia bacterium]|nr:helix-turn-helix domain-containing protein [Blastocatellia bacterium]
MTERTNKKRTGDSYAIESVLKALTVLEALEGSGFEPVTLKTVARRSKQNENYCFRALKTFEQMGYARQTSRGWQIGARLQTLSKSYQEKFGL